MKKRISPLPEAIDGEHWTVKEGAGSCDTVNRILGVPTDESPGSRFVRNHELGHAKITPRVPAFKQCRKFGVSMDAMQACEDLRVHRYLRETGIEMGGVLNDDEAEQTVRKLAGNDRLLAALLVASMHTDDHERFLEAMERHLDEDRRQHLIRTSSMVDIRMAQGRGLDRPIGFRNGTAPAARLFDALFPLDGESGPSLPLEGLCMPGRARQSKWGEMRVETLKTSRSRPIPATARSRAFTDHGAVLAAAHRLHMDGRVFTRRRRQRGGTVLIDASGSMLFRPSDLERITAAAPLATVAVYTGHGRSGTLAIVASRGRIAGAEALGQAARGNGNVIDGPALRWLAKQPEPRIWISDGRVTGVYDQPSSDLTVDAIHICRRAGITRAEKTADIPRLLEPNHGASR
jgi:hypothetical protein